MANTVTTTTTTKFVGLAVFGSNWLSPMTGTKFFKHFHMLELTRTDSLISI